MTTIESAKGAILAHLVPRLTTEEVRETSRLIGAYVAAIVRTERQQCSVRLAEQERTLKRRANIVRGIVEQMARRGAE